MNETGISATTSYTYDVLDDLTAVTQGSTARSFTYSSLKRLLSATNPETGTVYYTYDANGNLLTRLDARNITTAFSYDGLDEVLTKTHTNDPQNTPAVAYSYSYSWLVGVTYGGSSSGYTYTHDPIGRVNGGTQITGGQSYTFLVSLMPFVGIQSIAYPNSGRVVSTGYDAAGRANCVTAQSVASCGPTTAYVSSIGYAPQGVVSSMTLGNQLTVATQFNSRLQPTQIQVSGGLLTLGYGFSATQNNGNVASQSITRSGSTWTDTYAYDGANRLQSASESGSGSWTQSYGFDTRGNRWVSAYSGLPTPTAEVPLTSSWYGANNRVTAPTAWTYDASGNVLAVGGMLRSFTYDAENRQVSASVNGQSTTYTYDGDGRRVQKVAPSGTTVYVYDPFGNLAQEYSSAAPTDSGTKYLTADALDSTRLVTNSDGSLEKSYDYLPFGDEIESGTAGRASTFPTSAYPHPPSTQDLEFTSKERDAETGLDFFGARYLSSAQGRFTSPDPLLNSGRPWDPQSWNRYSYASNNPLRNVDPTGLYDLDNTCSADNKKCNKEFQQNAKDLKTQLANLQKQADKAKDPVQRARLQAGLAALGTEGDHNNVTVNFGATKGGGAGETNPIYDPATNSYSGFNVTFDPKQLTGSDAFAIAGAHEGTHVSDYENFNLTTGANVMAPFQIEYRGYQTSAFAASALGYSSFSANYDNKSFVIWNGSWGQVDKNITNFVTRFHDQNGQQTHPEPPDKVHNPLSN